MKREIGWLKFENITGGTADGRINIPSIHPVKAFRNIAPDQNAKSPDWLLYAHQEKVGALWEKTSKKGQPFLSGFLDSPKCRVILFEERDSDGLYRMYEGDN